MFRFTQDPSSGSDELYLIEITMLFDLAIIPRDLQTTTTTHSSSQTSTAYTHHRVSPKLFCNFDPHLAFHYIGDTPNNHSLSIAVQNMPPNSNHTHNKHN